MTTVTINDYKPEVGEALTTKNGHTVYYSHNQYNSACGTGFVCCPDKDMPERGNWSVFDELIPDNKILAKRIQTLLDKNIEQAKIITSITNLVLPTK